MASKTIEGVVVFGKFEKLDLYNWVDPATGQTKPIRSFKVLVPHPDGTITRESLTLPANYDPPHLKTGESYGFGVSISINKKRQVLSWSLRADMPPLPAPRIE